MAGKGGVGKTTLGATIGLAAARSGRDTLAVELEGHSSLGRPFGVGTLAYHDIELHREASTGGRLRARRITPDEALVEYLGSHGLERISGRLLRNGTVDVVSTAAPGIRDLLALGKIRQLEESGEVDLIIVDAPAAGHALTFLRAPAGLAGSSTSGPIREQALGALALLNDDKRCQVMLVALPEDTPVNELIETAYSLEEEVGVKLGPMVLNGCWPELAGLEVELSRLEAGPIRTKIGKARAEAARHRLQRISAQRIQSRRLSAELALPLLHLPFLFTTDITLRELTMLADALDDELTRLPYLGSPTEPS